MIWSLKEYVIENDYISFKRSPLSSTSRNQQSRSGTHHLHIENILRLTPDWPPILSTPSEEETKPPPEHLLVNENKKNNQTTTNEILWNNWKFFFCYIFYFIIKEKSLFPFSFSTANNTHTLVSFCT